MEDHIAPCVTPDDIIADDARETAAFLTWLVQECGYSSPVLFDDGRYACILPLLYTHAIITGAVGNRSSYSDRWCFAGEAAAKAALDAWDGAGEPQGWHRHPSSGRRRNVETGEEWIDP